MQDAGCGGQGSVPVARPRLYIRNSASSIHIRLFLAVLGTVCGFASNVVSAEVKIRERVVPQASVVRLGDVAEIKSADRQESRRLAAVPLMPAPAPGTQRFLGKREVADMLAASGVELQSVHFSGAEQVAVTTRSVVQTAAFERTATGRGTPINRHAAILAGVDVPSAPAQISAEQVSELNELVRRAIGDLVKSMTDKADPQRIECKLNDQQLAQLLNATSRPVCTGGSQPWTGRQVFKLSFTTAAGKEQFTVRAEVAQLAVPVVVAIRPVARGDVITAADIEVRMLDMTASPANKRVTFDTVDAVIGKEARQSLQPESIVYFDQTQSPILVKRGEFVTVGAQSGGIRVRTTAKAVQEGSQGDLIQVETLESKQRFDARVVGLREAVVYTPTPVEPPPRPKPPETADQRRAVSR